MNKFIKYSIIPIILLIFSFGFVNAFSVKGATTSKAECVIDVESLRVLHAVNQNEKLPPASTTKILTALTVIENFNVNAKVTVPNNAVGIEGSSIYLRAGENLTVKELLYGLMLRSGNDCAETLASVLTGDRSKFILLMNSTAKKYGALNSNFTNPHGLPDKNHYVTAYDLALISAYAMKNEIFREIVSTKRVSVSNDGYDYKRLLINKNKMLTTVDGATGIKTGYTKQAGRCLSSSVKRGETEYVSVVLNSPDMWNRSQEILNQAFANYKKVKVFDAEEFSSKIRATNKGKKFILYAENDFYYPLTKNEQDGLKYLINGKSIESYVKNPEKEGEIQIFIKNKLIFSQKIFSIYNR